MEKKEALKEWCIQVAVELYLSGKVLVEGNVEDAVLKVARKLEEYVIGCEKPTDVPAQLDETFTTGN